MASVTGKDLLGRRPGTFDYACMSLLTYRDMDEEDIRADTISDAIENDSRLPADKLKLSVDAWHALRHAGWEVLEQCRRDSGMICTVFFHSERQQLVFSYRGTQPSNIKSVRADIFHVMRDKAGSINDDAVNVAKRYARHRVFEKYKFLQVSTTGHSLGAWEAELVVFQLKLEFALHQRELPGAYARIWAVTFESPGSRTLMESRENQPGMLYKTNIVDSLDITTYMSKPNYINTFNRQATTCLYQITGEAIGNARGTIQIHDMATVYAGMQEALSEPNILRRCLAWPYRPWASGGTTANAQDPGEPMELSLKDMESVSHLYTANFVYPLSDLPSDIQDCLQNLDKYAIPEDSILRTGLALTHNEAGHGMELELKEGITLDLIKDEFFATVRIPQICKEHDIDPELAMNFAAQVERENAESIVEQRYKNFVYFGQVNIHEQPHGFGMAFFDDGSKYIGVWLRGSYYGYGIFMSGDPALPFEYRGQFLGGRMSGCGMLRLRRTNRDIADRLTQRELDNAYVGEFRDGKFLRMVNAVQKGLLAERQATKRACHIIATCEKARGRRRQDRATTKSFHRTHSLAVGGYQKDWLSSHFAFKSRALPFLSRGDGGLVLQRNNILPLLQRAACACHLAEVSRDRRKQLLREDYKGYFSHAEVQPTQTGSPGEHSQLVFIHESFQSGARRRFIVFTPEVTDELNNDPRSAYFQNLLSLVPMDYIQSWLRRGTQVIVVGHSIGGMLAVMLCAQVIIAGANLDVEMLRKSLFCITLGAPILPDTYILAGQLQRQAQDVWKEWCKTNRHYVLIKEDPVPALGVFLRKKEWPKTYLSLRDAGMLSSHEECRASVNLSGLQLGTNVLNVLKKEAIDGIPWMLDNRCAKNVGWKQVFNFVKTVAETKLLDIQADCTNHAINIYISNIIIALESLKTEHRQEAPQALSLEAPGESHTEGDLDMNTTITDVWVEVSDNGTTHFCLGGRELRLLSDVHVLPFSDTTSLQLGAMDELPEGSILIWSRDDRHAKAEAQWEQVSVTDTQVDFTVKLNRSRVLTLLNLSEALVAPRHIKGSIGRGVPRSKVAGLMLFARSLLAGQVIPVSMENITLPPSSSHMHSYLSSHSTSRDLASMAYLKAVLLRQAAMRLAQKRGVAQEDFDRVSKGEREAVQHEDTQAVDCMSEFLQASTDICKRMDEACCFLDLSTLLLAWLRTQNQESDERKKADVRQMLRTIIMSYFRLGSYASESLSDVAAAYRYKLPSTRLPEDLLRPLEDLLSDVDQVDLPAKTCKWDGFLPDYSSLVSDVPPRFRDSVECFSFSAALDSQPCNIQQALDPSSLQQTQLLLSAENAIELFHIFFDGDFPFHSRRTVDRFWASMTSLPSTVVFSVASAFVKPFFSDDAAQRQKLDRKTAYLRRHRQYQQATITGFNMKLALLARLLPQGSSDFSCLSVIEEAVLRNFTNIMSVEALKTRLQRHEEADGEGLLPKLREFVKNMEAMGISSQDNPHAFESICRWIYAVVNVRKPVLDRLLEHPIVGVYGAQGAGKSLMLNQLGFDTKSAFGDGNTKAFDVHPIGSTGVLIADSFGFNEAVGGDAEEGGACSEEFLRAKSTFGGAFLGQLRYVIYVSSSSSQRGYNKEEDESLLRLRNVPCHVLYLITKFDSFLKRFGDDESDVAHKEAQRILAERRERNAHALPGKTVETRFYSSITPRGFEKAMDDAYEKLNGDFWRPEDLKAHMRKVLVLHCNVDPEKAAEELGMQIDKEQDVLPMPATTTPLYS